MSNTQLFDSQSSAAAWQAEPLSEFIDSLLLTEGQTEENNQNQPNQPVQNNSTINVPANPVVNTPPAPLHSIPLEISTMDASTANMPGFETKRGINITKLMEQKYNQGAAFPNFSLNAPAVNGQRVMMGTDHEGKDNALVLVDTSTMRNGHITADPIIAAHRSDQPIVDLKWMDGNTVVAAVGEHGDPGLLRVYDVAQSAPGNPVNIVQREQMVVSEHQIRQVAMNQIQRHWIVVGGFDNSLQIMDLNHSPRSIYTRNVGSIVGSIKWETFTNNRLVSCTTDDGKMLMFDACMNLQAPPAVSLQAHAASKDGLFSHERYTETMVLLGFGDGTIEHYDLRNTNQPLSSVRDPFVDAIGEMSYNAQSRMLVTSGLTDFTVWKQDQYGDLSVWSHSALAKSKLKQTGSSSHMEHAVFVDPNTVFSCNTNGNAGLYLQ